VIYSHEIEILLADSSYGPAPAQNRAEKEGITMIVVIGHLRIPPEKMSEARPAIGAVVRETRKEPGCLLYAFSEDVLEPGTIRIAEKWESWDALKAHGTMPHLAAWRETLQAVGVREREVIAYQASETRAL
jgi:quinol monooxygenase YgiN